MEKSKKIALIALIVVVLGIAGVAGYFLLGNEDVVGLWATKACYQDGERLQSENTYADLRMRFSEGGSCEITTNGMDRSVEGTYVEDEDGKIVIDGGDTVLEKKGRRLVYEDGDFEIILKKVKEK